jgi:hypothetical protein
MGLFGIAILPAEQNFEHLFLMSGMFVTSGIPFY